jgi:hypothetical protein
MSRARVAMLRDRFRPDRFRRARAGLHEASANLVTVSVQLDDSRAALPRRRDGSGRYYIDGADRGAATLGRLGDNRLSAELRRRHALTVDGLNAISGRARRGAGACTCSTRAEHDRPGWRHFAPGRAAVHVRQTSGARTPRAPPGQREIGWIEVAVYRECAGSYAHERCPCPIPSRAAVSGRGEGGPRALPGAAAPGSARPRRAPRARTTTATPRPARRSRERRGRRRSYPGTGWGQQATTPVVLVSF